MRINMVGPNAKPVISDEEKRIQLGETDIKIIKTALVVVGAIAGTVIAIGSDPVKIFGKVIEFSKSTVKYCQLSAPICFATQQIIGIWQSSFARSLGGLHNVN